ncbi:MAG: GlxA family transcriptional regulator [Tepidamorphaceae bacterium]
MKVDSFRVGFLLIDGFPLISYAAAIEPLRTANLISGESLYEIKHLPTSGARSASSSGSEVRATAHVGETVDFDLVLVIAGGELSRFDDPRVFSWLRLLARRGIMIGGISAGPVILARAGIMQNRRMTAHWEHAEALLETNPALLVERSVYVVDRDRMSCAGGTAAFDMMLAMISEHHGVEFANRVSDQIGHTGMRQPDPPQRTGPAGRHMTTSRPVRTVIQAMQDHIADPLSLSKLANMAGVGERHLVRLFSEKLGQTPMSFYRDMRLDKARALVDRSTLNLTEIALACGFSNSAHFSQAYSTRFGHAPSHQRKTKVPA